MLKESLLSPANLFLAGLIVYIPNQLHFPTGLGFTGLNVLNLLFIVTLFIAISRARAAPTDHPLNLKARILFLFAAIFLSFLIAQAHSVVFFDSLLETKRVIFYPLFYFVFFHVVRNEVDLEFFYSMILFVAFVAGIEMLLEAADYGFRYMTGRRAAGPFGDWRVSNRAGVFMAIMYPLFLGALIHLRSRRILRLIAAVGCGVCIFAIFYTYSRQAYLTAALITVMFALRRSLPLLVLATLAIIFHASWLPEGAQERLGMTVQVDDFGDQQLESSTASRLEIWEGGLQIVAKQPWGIGIGRFKEEIGNYTNYAGFDAHNQYILIAAEQGLQGLLAFVALILTLLALGRAASKAASTEEQHAVATGFFYSTVALAIGCIYGSPFFHGELIGNYWILAALAARNYIFASSGGLNDDLANSRD